VSGRPAPALRRRTALRYWLAPGMGVKRHVFLAVAGGVVFALGMAALSVWLLGDERGTASEPIEAVLASGVWSRVGGWVAFATLVTGVWLAAGAVRRLNRSLLSHWLPEPSEAAARLYDRLQRAKGPRIVALGGGTGLSRLLRGLRGATSNLTAVVAVSDDGGSSGRLREAFGMPAPGDLVDCLAALSNDEVALGRLLDYRFERGAELEGHTFGNLFLTTLTEVEGDFGDALRTANRMLDLGGAVYPATARPVALRVRKRDGRELVGERHAHEGGGAIAEVRLVPNAPDALPEVLEAIDAATMVVLGPGSLYTSTLPPLLVPDVGDALRRSQARLVYVCNIMTEAGETTGLSAWEHVQALHDHLGRYPDVVIVNDEPIDDERLAAYAEERADVVTVAPDRFREAGIRLMPVGLVDAGRHAQHDPARLAAALLGLAHERGGA
jgi:uncharacterized cofD-like protein